MARFVDNQTVEGLLTLSSLVTSLTTTATTLNGTLTLVAASTCAQYLSGTQTGFSLVLPSAATLVNGAQYQIHNTSSQPVLLKTNGGATLVTIGATTVCYAILVTNGTAAGTWSVFQILTGVIASGVVNYNIVSTTAFSTSSTTDVAITGFTVTPQSGLYAVWYSASVFHTTTPISHTWTIYKGGVAVADSIRSQDTAHSNQTMIDSTQSIISCTGSQAVDIRVKRGTSGTLTVNARSLILIRLGS